MKVEFLVTGRDQECGIATYTTTLARALAVESHRTPLKLRSLNLVHYLRRAVQAGLTDAEVIHLQHEYDIYGPKSVASWIALPVVWLLARVRGRPIVTTLHSAWTRETVGPPLLGLKMVYLRLNNRMIAAVTDHAIFLSAETRDAFEQTASLANVTVVGHGVPTDLHPVPQEEAKRRFGIDPDRPLVAEPGFVRPQKGYHLFLDVAEHVDDAAFLIAGGIQEGEYADYLANIETRAGDDVAITGVLEDEKFHAAFSAMDVALLPYETVTQSGILNWCLAYEVPVVGTDIEEFRELNETYGFPAVFEADDPQAGAEAVRSILDNPEPLLAAMRAYRDDHGMDEVAAAHVDLYQSVVARSNLT